MSIYTVHEPPLRGTQSEPDPNRFVFVRDGFSFWAFLIPPLWMLRHRLWLVLVIYLGVAILLQAGLYAIGASFGVRFATSALLHLFVGIEAATLRRVTLARRRWTNIGVVVGDDLEAAEQRFFDTWVRHAPRASPTVRPPASAIAVPAPASDIIGLFPQPGASR
jgi:Protein of unknown function (DUF2628)